LLDRVYSLDTPPKGLCKKMAHAIL